MFSGLTPSFLKNMFRSGPELDQEPSEEGEAGPDEPETQPPTLNETVFEFVDYALHRALLESTVAGLEAWKTSAETSLTASSADVPLFGRLFSRMHAVALWADALQLLAKAQDTASADDWHGLSERWVSLRVMMVRRDANSLGQDDDEQDASPMVELDEYDMFTRQYQDVLLRLKVQACLCQFRQALMEQSQNRLVSPIRLCEEAVQEYKEGLEEAFGDQETPDALLGFVRTDLLRKNQNPAASTAALLNDIEKCQTGSVEDDDDEEDYTSLTKLKQRIHSLLKEWAECVFDAPAMAKHYKGPPTPAQHEAAMAEMQAESQGETGAKEDDDDMPMPDDDEDNAFLQTQAPEPEQEPTPRSARRNVLPSPRSPPRSEPKRKGGETPSSAKKNKYNPMLEAAEKILEDVDDPTKVAMGYVYKRLGEEPYFYDMTYGNKVMVLHHLEDVIRQRQPAKPAARGDDEESSSEEEEEEEEEQGNKEAGTTAEDSDSSAERGEPSPKRRKRIDWPDSSEDEGKQLDQPSPKIRSPSGHKVPFKRGGFSEEEEEAMREGIRRGLQKGDWEGVWREVNNGALAGRTGVQIKDKYRNMVGRVSSGGGPRVVRAVKPEDDHDDDMEQEEGTPRSARRNERTPPPRSSSGKKKRKRSSSSRRSAEPSDDPQVNAVLEATDELFPNLYGRRGPKFTPSHVNRLLEREPHNFVLNSRMKREVVRRLDTLINEEQGRTSLKARLPTDPHELRQATEELFDEIEDPDNVELDEFIELLEEEQNVILDEVAKEIVQHKVEELLHKQRGTKQGSVPHDAGAQEESTEEDNASPSDPDDLRDCADELFAKIGKKVTRDVFFERFEKEFDTELVGEDKKVVARRYKELIKEEERAGVDWSNDSSEEEGDDLWDDSPTPRQRSASGHKKPMVTGPFSEEEIDALREGIRLGMKGQWEQMRKVNNGALAGRTGVQIKDKYRNMHRTNKI